MMTYSWHNINKEYKNNEIKYSTNGSTSWETITFVDGMYSYSDINDYIHQYMDKKSIKQVKNTILIFFLCCHHIEL